MGVGDSSEAAKAALAASVKGLILSCNAEGGSTHSSGKPTCRSSRKLPLAATLKCYYKIETKDRHNLVVSRMACIAAQDFAHTWATQDHGGSSKADFIMPEDQDKPLP